MLFFKIKIGSKIFILWINYDIKNIKKLFEIIKIKVVFKVRLILHTKVSLAQLGTH